MKSDNTENLKTGLAPSKLAQTSPIYANDPSLKKKDVVALADWLLAQPHLPQLAELQLMLFLHSCHYDLQAAKNTIESYFECRRTSILFPNFTDVSARTIFKSFFIGFLPKRTPRDEAVFLISVFDARPEVYDCVEHNKVIVAVLLLYFHQFGPAKGLILVFDVKDSSLGHMLRISVSSMRQLIFFVQEAAPVRLTNLHHINASPLVERFVSLVRPFLRNEVYNQMKMHSRGFESFYEYVPKECLPVDYGGTLKTIEEIHAQNVRNFFEHWDVLQWLDAQKVDEVTRMRKKDGFFGRFRLWE